MGESLLKYYQYISKLNGLEGRIQLAQNTKLPSNKASLEPDSPENINLFKKAVEKITGKPAPDF
jgi:hypothetical protein